MPPLPHNRFGAKRSIGPGRLTSSLATDVDTTVTGNTKTPAARKSHPTFHVRHRTEPNKMVTGSKTNGRPEQAACRIAVCGAKQILCFVLPSLRPRAILCASKQSRPRPCSFGIPAPAVSSRQCAARTQQAAATPLQRRSVHAAVAQNAEAVTAQDSEFGRKYIVDGQLEGAKESAAIRTIWIVERDSGAPRFETAYPRRGV